MHCYDTVSGMRLAKLHLSAFVLRSNCVLKPRGIGQRGESTAEDQDAAIDVDTRYYLRPALAPEPVKDAVKNAVHAVATALNNGAKDIITTVKNAASGIVHSVLNFFGWMENSVYAAITGQRGRVPVAKLPDELVV